MVEWHTAHNRRYARARGFTLIEIMVVVIIIGVLATLIIPQLFSRVGQAKQNVAKQKMASIEQAIQMFQYDYGRLPRSLDELVSRPSDIEPSNWNEPTLEPEDLTDPWGNQWHYEAPGEHGKFDLYSYGKDEQPGGEGVNADVTNWSEQ
jgi:general secretion pathway protein G